MNNINLELGVVTKKKIATPNDFVSHMIEHVAWRMGFSIDLRWESDNWFDLGVALGNEIKNASSVDPGKIDKEIAVLGSIDDGTAKVKITFSKTPEVLLSATKNVDLDLLRNSRCEQIENSPPLEELLKGIAKALETRIEIVVLNLKDQHHTWEGVFRSVGICLQKGLTPIKDDTDLSAINIIEKNVSEGNISVLERSLTGSKVRRGTAESGVTVEVDFMGNPKYSSCEITVGDSIKPFTKDADKILMVLAESMNARLDVEFRATVLSSSHVVFEDIGLVLGRSLLEILKLRFDKTGAMGAGSSINSPEYYENQNGSVCISVEGRKFWDFIALDGNEKNLLENLIIGKDVFGKLRSEDLDDFIDGLSGGMTSSIIIHINKVEDPDKLWQEIFRNIGTALKEVFRINPNRKGVPPGVKATLS